LNRDEKSAVVSELNESFNRAKFTVVTDYCGLTVSELEELRGELRKCDSEIRVAKNTLLKRAVSNTSSEKLAGDFTGTTAVVLGFSDPVSPAKALTKFADGHAKFKIRCAALEGDRLTIDDLITLSKLPTRDVLLGQFLSVLNGVPTGLVQVLSAVPRTFLYGLQAIKERKEQAEN
jgi:large subunit ribosomal protein L10